MSVRAGGDGGRPQRTPGYAWAPAAGLEEAFPRTVTPYGRA
ncbi:hypothetical protein ACFFHJ_16370 [Planotetraspora thailandica]|nr:hypothetical protein [Planotetraspora thailandica]